MEFLLLGEPLTVPAKAKGREPCEGEWLTKFSPCLRRLPSLLTDSSEETPRSNIRPFLGETVMSPSEVGKSPLARSIQARGRSRSCLWALVLEGPNRGTPRRASLCCGPASAAPTTASRPLTRASVTVLLPAGPCLQVHSVALQPLPRNQPHCAESCSVRFTAISGLPLISPLLDLVSSQSLQQSHSWIRVLKVRRSRIHSNACL